MGLHCISIEYDQKYVCRSMYTGTHTLFGFQNGLFFNFPRISLHNILPNARDMLLTVFVTFWVSDTNVPASFASINFHYLFFGHQ